MQLYRFSMVSQSEEYEDCTLECQEFQVIKETEKCYTISLPSAWTFNGKEQVRTKRCLKNAWKKGFAHDTKEKALRHFMRRMNTRIAFLEADARIAKNGIKEAEILLAKMQ